jgi:hypothetical protein
VSHWKQRRDQLYAVSRGQAVVIRDTRSVAVASQTVLTGAEKLVFEICDQITTVRRIQQIVRQQMDPAVSENDVREILETLMRRRLVIREEERYLGLPVLTYAPADRTTQPVRQFVPAAAVPSSEHLIHA